MRFSLLMLLGIVALIAVNIAALRTGDWFWCRLLFTLTLTVHLAAILGAVYRRGSERAFWIGFALFGWTYLSLANVPMFRLAEHQLFGSQVSNLLKGFTPEANDGIAIESSGSRIAIFSFRQIIHSASALLFASLGGLLGVYFQASGQDTSESDSSTPDSPPAAGANQ